MVNRRISSDIKECALRLWELGWDRDAICSTLLVSQSSIYRWAALFEEFGSVSPPPSPIIGRPRIIGLAALTAIKEIYTKHADTYLLELQWWLLIHHDISISISSLQETLERAGLTRKLLHKIAVERRLEQEQARCLPPLWSRSNWDPSRFRRCIHSLDGYIAQRVFEGSLDSFDFFDFITEDVVPQMGVFPDDRSVLVMDNCRIHHTDTLREVLNAQGKAYLRANVHSIRAAVDPILVLLDSTGCITPEKARAWFHHAGYIVRDDNE
ncbi:hypothetical protein C8F04DRAFT_1210512 [Mycena alexandri]|uniref:Tc1-like transposase DDE domain-containing protein n=1 Tax=Mycena alexandri TaxID=1745969 RepID=A0AAD6SVW0_9AGAR|nr:hypothetical protein C8F04DRAFT_1210512 [Mycena alexandri]